MTYKIFETDEFMKRMDKLSLQQQEYITKKLRNYVYPQIRQEPFWGKNIKKLRDYTPETWRYRIGNFRLFYVVDIEEKIVNILTIVQRKDAY